MLISAGQHASPSSLEATVLVEGNRWGWKLGDSAQMAGLVLQIEEGAEHRALASGRHGVRLCKLLHAGEICAK